MPIVHTDKLQEGLDEEDQRRYHYCVNKEGSSNKLGEEGREGNVSGNRNRGGGGNATGTTLDTDEYGYQWQSNLMQSKTSLLLLTDHSFTTESNYPHLRHVEEYWEESSSVVTTLRYLFHDHYTLEERGGSGYALVDDDRKAISSNFNIHLHTSLPHPSPILLSWGWKTCPILSSIMIMIILVLRSLSHRDHEPRSQTWRTNKAVATASVINDPPAIAPATETESPSSTLTSKQRYVNVPVQSQKKKEEQLSLEIEGGILTHKKKPGGVCYRSLENGEMQENLRAAGAL
ncbi:hypothetical protein F5876DRAFT_64924 [Lentinula aff. lateritia]|uniref:Uncharacterized protein n=1 Tax=Lentinula aff. lateritia TaxID=2804960 RepID=A0ACC1U3T6_9AGAR|nr:hypothetical protein F5876DRAFT_64924 [Lentinula aff. lateritia]